VPTTSKRELAVYERKTLRFGKGFRVTFGNRRARRQRWSSSPAAPRAAQRTGTEVADQWLFVVAVMAWPSSRGYVIRSNRDAAPD